MAGYEVSAKFLPVDPDALAQKAMTMLPPGWVHSRALKASRDGKGSSD